MFLGTFLYAIGFVGNLLVPKSVDSGDAGPLGQALIINALLLGVFAIQHSVMARQSFKQWWTQLLPAPIERSTYVLFSNLALILLYWQWRAIPGVIWTLEGTAAMVLWGLFALGWAIVLVSTLLINHFDLFGLRQVWLRFQEKEYSGLDFTTPGFYQYVRHPIYVGFMIAFWATPTMTVGHLVFALATTGYIIIAAKLSEDRDLVAIHGERYETYMDQVGAFVPTGRYRGPSEAKETL